MTVTQNSIIYTIADDNTAYVGQARKTNSNGHVLGTNAAGELVIPSSIFYNDKTYRVIKVAAYAFRQSKITRLLIRKGISRLEDRSFNECKQLEEIILPGSITFIGTCSFGNAHALKRAIIKPSLNEITLESSAFGIDIVLEKLYLCSGKIIADPGMIYNVASNAVIYKRIGVEYNHTSIKTEVSDFCNLRTKTFMIQQKKIITGVFVFVFIAQYT